ncbi:hypothetical protein GF324_12155 [bacterium]|nr:hypothetical protein [bacterium]
MAGEGVLSVEEAILTAIEFETKVRDTYREAVEKADNEIGERIFKVLMEEEQGHLDYLNSRLEEWRKTGKIQPEKIESKLPTREQIDEQVKGLEKKLEVKDRGVELRMLQKALDVEEQTSNFYQRMVDTMEDDEKMMFSRFLEIEEGHLAIVQAEIDSVTGMGFYFDMAEFNLEAG